MIWIHGGGFIIGTPEQDQANLIEMCRDLGMTVAAVAYRLSPDHPFPAALNDCYAALEWLHGAADDLGVARDRIAVGGNSAGAGLAAGVVQFAHDAQEVPIAFQLLIYPMLDDRTTNRTDIDQKRLRMWNSKSNVVGWTAYLGHRPGGEGVPGYAAPARRENLAGLPPAWIGVGTCDLFHDEDVAYARRLMEAGVPCTLKVVEGAFHGFELAGKAKVVEEFRASYIAAMRAVVGAP
jgi:acetyl esterase/lipase